MSWGKTFFLAILLKMQLCSSLSVLYIVTPEDQKVFWNGSHIVDEFDCSILLIENGKCSIVYKPLYPG